MPEQEEPDFVTEEFREQARAKWEDYLSADEDEITDIEKPKFDDSTDTFIAVDGLPVVGMDRHDKLVGFVAKKFNVCNTQNPEFTGTVGVIQMPTDEKQVSQGYAFLEMESPQAAKAAVAKFHNLYFDKQHTTKVYLFSDFDKYESIPEQYKEPTVPNFEELENPMHWCLDARCRDQYCVHTRRSVTVNWFDPMQPDSAYDEKSGSPAAMDWSPKGTYMVTWHGNQVQLWAYGGESTKLARIYEHGLPGKINNIDFSPCEKFLVVSIDNEGPEGVFVIDLVARRRIKAFPHVHEKIRQWPELKWEPKSSLCARLDIHKENEIIFIYEVPTFTLSQGKPLFVPRCKTFEWSPSDSYIGYWIAEKHPVPARCVLMELPSRREIRNKNIFGVEDMTMIWHPQGDYLAFHVERRSKSKFFTDFEFFRIRDRDVPVEQLEIKESGVKFSWEPNGPRFGIIVGDDSRPDVQFYSMEKKNPASIKKCELLVTLKKRAATELVWSPQGSHCIIAGVGSNGGLEFYSVDNQLQLGEGEHFGCRGVVWDPSGRTAVSYNNKSESESGYYVWTWNGTLSERVPAQGLLSFKWRPRPPTLLSKQQLSDIRAHLKKYSEKYEREDQQLLQAADDSAQAERRKKRDEWNKYREETKEWWAKQADRLRKIQAAGHFGSIALAPREYVTVKEEVETVLSETQREL